MVRVGLDARLLAADPPVVRPQDATWWAAPSKELAALARDGLIASPAHGYYVVPPPQYVGDHRWRPTLEGFALAFAQRVEDAATVALMGVSAARMHGAFPRAVAVAVVTLPSQRRPLRTTWGRVVPVTRDLSQLDTLVTETDLVEGWVTSIEQTLLDLADRPQLAHLPGEQVSESLVALGMRADWDRVARLADAQRKKAAWLRARWVTAAVVDHDHGQLPPPSKFATTGGLKAAHDYPPAEFGLHVRS